MRLLLVLWICIKEANANITSYYNEDKIQDVIKCLTHITDKEIKFNPRGFIIITKTFDMNHPADEIQNKYLEMIHQTMKTTIMTIGNDLDDIKWRRGEIITKAEHDESDEVGMTFKEDVFIQSHLLFIRLADVYVMVVDSYRMFNSKIKELVRVPSWNARAPMLIYCSKNTTTKKRMMLYPTNIFTTLWSYHVLNAVLLMHDFQNETILNIYSWNPYDPPRRCGEKKQMVNKYIELYDRCIGGDLGGGRKLFPDKIPADMKGCPVKVLGVIWHPFLNHNTTDDNPGFDRTILNVIAERLNFTIDLDTSEGMWGDRIDNGSWDGVMGGLKKSLGEIAIGAIYPDNDVHEDFDATLSYLQDSYVWIVPRAREIPQWENLIVILQANMWIASGAVYLICTMVWYAMTKIPWEKGISYKNLTPSILDTWCMNLSTSFVSRPSSDGFRIYFVFFCIYSMIWCTAYQTKLITVFTNPSYEHQMTTTDELLKSDLKFGGNEAFRFLFNNSIDDIEDHLYSNYLALNIHEVLDHVINYRNLSVLTSKLYVRYLSATTTHYNDAYGVPLFIPLLTKVFSFPVEMVAVKGFALLKKFDSLLSRFKSNGLIQHFYMDFKILAKRSAANLARENGYHKDSNQSIRIEHLQGAFFALVLGSSVSMVVFLGEILLHRRSMSKVLYGKRRWAHIVHGMLNRKNEKLGLRIKQNHSDRNYVMRWIFWLDKDERQ